MLTAGLRRSVIVTTSPAVVRRWQEERAAEIAPADRNRARWQIQALPTKAAAEAHAASWLTGR
jgi:hypothetical protein